MGAHGVLAHVKAPSNSGFAAALGDKHGNLGLAFRQAKVSPQALKPRDLGGAEGMASAPSRSRDAEVPTTALAALAACP